jgi:hypothetical protein
MRSEVTTQQFEQVVRKLENLRENTRRPEVTEVFACHTGTK